MRGHIVGPFQRMHIGVIVLWHKTIEDGFHVRAHIGIGILVNAQPTAGMHTKKIDNARLGQLRQVLHNLIRHKMKPSCFRTQRYLYLLYHRQYI